MYFNLRPLVKCWCCFIKQKNTWISNESSCNRYPLFLSARHFGTFMTADDSVTIVEFRVSCVAFFWRNVKTIISKLRFMIKNKATYFELSSSSQIRDQINASAFASSAAFLTSWAVACGFPYNIFSMTEQLKIIGSCWTRPNMLLRDLIENSVIFVPPIVI